MSLVPPSSTPPDNPLAIVSYIATVISILVCIISGTSLIATVFWKRIFTEINHDDLNEFRD